jgi:hypothetical protein
MAVDISELLENSMNKLIEFSRACFGIAWGERDRNDSKTFYRRIKELDKDTERLVVPSRSGKNFASQLKL